jgi:hypothetical protein
VAHLNISAQALSEDEDQIQHQLIGFAKPIMGGSKLLVGDLIHSAALSKLHALRSEQSGPR